jgi:hypothetical protein
MPSHGCQTKLVAMLIVNATMAVLNTKDSTDCNSTRRRTERFVMTTSAV